MSFVEQEDIFDRPAGHSGLFENSAAAVRSMPNWPRIPYAESMLKYGGDKPDLRNPIEMQVFRPFPRARALASSY